MKCGAPVALACGVFAGVPGALGELQQGVGDRCDAELEKALALIGCAEVWAVAVAVDPQPRVRDLRPVCRPETSRVAGREAVPVRPRLAHQVGTEREHN